MASNSVLVNHHLMSYSGKQSSGIEMQTLLNQRWRRQNINKILTLKGTPFNCE